MLASPMVVSSYFFKSMKETILVVVAQTKVPRQVEQTLTVAGILADDHAVIRRQCKCTFREEEEKK